MNFDVFKKIIEENLKDFKDKNVSYEGELGDPMVHPKIENFIDFGCDTFNTLRIVTNGGNRRPTFYEKLAKTYDNLEMTFSIDGLDKDTNEIYRRRVNTQNALNNMISFSKFKPRKTYWQFLVFNHNFFEIPEVIELSKKYEIYEILKILNVISYMFYFISNLILIIQNFRKTKLLNVKVRLIKKIMQSK